MKKFWIWFIPLLLIIALIVYLELIKINKSASPLKLESKLDDVVLLAEVDGRKIYTQYSVDYYNNESLRTLLNNKKITIDDIIKKMKYSDALNDGGTIIYYSDSNELSNTNFYLVACNTLSGNKDVYIGDTKELANNCRK